MVNLVPKVQVIYDKSGGHADREQGRADQDYVDLWHGLPAREQTSARCRCHIISKAQDSPDSCGFLYMRFCSIRGQPLY